MSGTQLTLTTLGARAPGSSGAVSARETPAFSCPFSPARAREKRPCWEGPDVLLPDVEEVRVGKFRPPPWRRYHVPAEDSGQLESWLLDYERPLFADLRSGKRTLSDCYELARVRVPHTVTIDWRTVA